MSKKYLPEIHKTITETIKGKRVQKWLYSDKSYGICENGTVTRYFPDGKIQTYNREYDKEWDNYVFILAKESLPDGTLYKWYHDGRQSYEKLPDGTIRCWYENGQMELEKLSDGTEREFYSDGKMRRAKLPDGTIIEWDHYSKSYGLGGRIKNEKINNILMREWYENGQLAYKKSPNGEEIRYDKLGRITWHATKGIEDTQKYLEIQRILKQRNLKTANTDTSDTQDGTDWQLEMCKKLRQKALSKYEELVSASKSEIEEDTETPATDLEEKKSENENCSEKGEETKAQEEQANSETIEDNEPQEASNKTD